jgi:hypothetical protein
MNDIIVRLIKLPLSIDGCVLPDENGDYNIYINDRLPADIQQKALEHELNHVERGEIYSERYIEYNELFAC